MFRETFEALKEQKLPGLKTVPSICISPNERKDVTREFRGFVVGQ